MRGDTIKSAERVAGQPPTGTIAVTRPTDGADLRGRERITIMEGTSGGNRAGWLATVDTGGVLPGRVDDITARTYQGDPARAGRPRLRRRTRHDYRRVQEAAGQLAHRLRRTNKRAIKSTTASVQSANADTPPDTEPRCGVRPWPLMPWQGRRRRPPRPSAHEPRPRHMITQNTGPLSDKAHSGLRHGHVRVLNQSGKRRCAQVGGHQMRCHLRSDPMYVTYATGLIHSRPAGRVGPQKSIKLVKQGIVDAQGL